MNFNGQHSKPNWDAIQSGDTHAFADFVDAHKNLVSSIAYSMTGDLAGSEDIAQEAFLIAWQSRHELHDPQKVVGWLSAIARNLAKQWLRKRSGQTWATDGLDESAMAQEQPNPVERLVSDEEQHLVWSALKEIPEGYREVMILYYRESHSIADVASALQITEEAARQRLSRGRHLLRAEVERTIEAALTKTRPSSTFTTGVISLIAVGSGSTVAKAAATITAGAVGKSATSGAVLGATQAAASGAIIGTAGGLLGIMAGMGGAWLGIRVPQLMAPTMAERKVFEREGRVTWRLALCFLAAHLGSVVLTLFYASKPNAVMIAVLGNMLMGLCFAVICVVRSIRMNKQVQRIRDTVTPEQDPNPTWLKDRLGLTEVPGKLRWVGRKATSQYRLLGWPLFDFQVSDPTNSRSMSSPLHAKGWFAVGDKATGLVAIGGIARGVLAIGGLALGLFSCGGLCLGVVSLGGTTLGLLSMGGLAVGHSALGGGAIGWQAAGGGALGVYSANGGLAVAGHIAEGGLAISKKYAVGGEARAPEANTPAARDACAKSWVGQFFNSQAIAKNPGEFRQKVLIYGTVLPIVLSVLLGLGLPMLMYRRQPWPDAPPT